MIRVKIKVPLYADPFGDNDIGKPITGFWFNAPCGQLGNQASKAENMSEEAHKRRMAALFAMWKTPRNSNKGKRMAKKRAETIRQKVKLTVAKEAREIQDEARRTAASAIEVVKDLMVNAARDSDRLAAANLILERAYGKATQVNVNENMNRNGTPKEVSAEELDQRINAALERAEELAGRAPKPTTCSDGSPHVRIRDRNTGGSSVH